MRLLAIIVVGVFLVTYAWGWLVHVPDGPMTTRSYTNYYMREATDQIKFFIESVGKVVEFAKKPLTRPKEINFQDDAK